MSPNGTRGLKARQFPTGLKARRFLTGLIRWAIPGPETHGYHQSSLWDRRDHPLPSIILADPSGGRAGEGSWTADDTDFSDCLKFKGSVPNAAQ